MRGKLYGVGVGPGDPELLTLKAKRILESVDLIAVPKTQGQRDSRALAIAEAALDLRKPILDLVLPMSSERDALDAGWRAAAGDIMDALERGKDVAMISLGDPTLYSTFMYVYEVLKERGVVAEIVPGVTSFCACAARSGTSLAENGETLAIVPSARECPELDAILDDFDNIVLMKVAASLDTVRDKLEERGLEESCVLVSRCGQEGELVERDLGKVLGKKLSYFTTLIVTKRRKSP